MADLSPQTDPDSPTSSDEETGFWTRLKAWLGAPGNSETNLRESLEGVLEEHGGGSEALKPEERHMLMNLLEFGELRVEDVMVPRADIVALDQNTTLAETLAMCGEEAHSRMPIFRDTLDDPIGMVHIKDILSWLARHGEAEAAATFDLRKLRRDLLFVPPSMSALDLLLKMQTTRHHLALVIDEYGGTDGLVSIEDLVEQIVGDIEDEHDVEQGPILHKRPNGDVDADARAPIEDLEEMIGLSLVDEDSEDDVDTLGGLVVALLGRVPQRGELVSHPSGLQFEVKDADPRRVKKLLIRTSALSGERTGKTAANR